MTDLVDGLGGLVEEVRALREQLDEQDKELAEWKRQAELHRKLFEDASRELARVREETEVLDGSDEAWLLRHRAEIHCARRGAGGNVVSLRAHGRKLLFLRGPEVPDGSLIREVVRRGREKLR